MDKKSLKVKIFLNFFGTYKEVRQAADISTTQVKRGEHDWRACASFSARRWMDNKSVILLLNYHDPRAVHYSERRVKGSKDKLKFSLFDCYS